MSGRVVQLDGKSLSLDDVWAVAVGGQPVCLAEHAVSEMERSARWVATAAEGGLEAGSLPVYGVNTGFGSLVRERISGDQIELLSWNLLCSHAAGVGPIASKEETRAMMLLRANALAKGASGCRPAVVETLCRMLNGGVHPEIPSRGSCGSSGDLAPLAHLGIVVFCDPRGSSAGGTAIVDGRRLTAEAAMQQAGIERLVPGPKDGLSMTNGAQLSTGIGALAVVRAERLRTMAEAAAALSFEALRGTSRALRAEVHAVRPFAGAIACAAHLRTLLQGSRRVDSVDGRVQDAYSLRCTPQIVGGVRDAIDYCRAQLGVEINAATDNPLILMDVDGANKAHSAGMFHGEPVGMAADHLRHVVAELGALSERRVFRMTAPELSGGLGLGWREGVDEGLDALQAVAAALVARGRQRAFPTSVDSLPTCEDQEDLVAMSTVAAIRASETVADVETLVAIETICAVRAITSGDDDPAPALSTLVTEVAARIHASATPSEAVEYLLKAIRSGSALMWLREAQEHSHG